MCIKGRVKNVKRFVPSDLTSKLSSMDHIMMFEPFLEKIVGSLFSEISGKGGTLKLDNR